MSVAEDPVLVNIKMSLEHLLTKIQDMKMDICVLQTYVEQEMNRK